MLAAHAAVAIENARLHERSRELSIVEERNRLARELHDSVSQKLFGVVLGAESAGTLLDRDPGAAAEQVARMGELAQEALGELRGLIFELRPASLEDEGLAATLRKHVDVLRRVHGRAIELRIAGAAHCAPEAEGEVLRIAQEALNNALRHADAERIEVRLEGARRAPDRDRRRRRDRLRPRRPRAARAPARADLDGGARARARRHAGRRLARRARARRSRSRCRDDPRADRRRPRRRPPGPAHVPRPAGRHRGRRARPPTAPRRWPPPSSTRPTSC